MMQRALIVQDDLATRGRVAALISHATCGIADLFRAPDCPEEWLEAEREWEAMGRPLTVCVATKSQIDSMCDSARAGRVPSYHVEEKVLALGPWPLDLSGLEEY